MDKRITILNPELSKKYKVKVHYIQIHCECGKTFGITPDEFNQIEEKQLRCFRCAAYELEKVLAENEKQ